MTLVCGSAFAQSFTEGFDDITTLAGNGWAQVNNSDSAANAPWFQGNASVFPANSGATNSYIATNFARSSGTVGNETLSVWLITPELLLQTGDTFSFLTRTTTGNPFPDRIEVRMSLAGASTNVGANSSSVGDFTTLLATVNPNLTVGGYPETWTQITVNVTGLTLGTHGRFAIRYFVTDGGPNGANSNYIGVDDASYTAVPEPATMAVLGAGALALIRRRRKA